MAHVSKRPVSSRGVYNRTFFSNVTRLLHDSWYFCVLTPPFISHFVRGGFISVQQLSSFAQLVFPKGRRHFLMISRRRTLPLRRCSRPCCAPSSRTAQIDLQDGRNFRALAIAGFWKATGVLAAMLPALTQCTQLKFYTASKACVTLGRP